MTVTMIGKTRYNAPATGMNDCDYDRKNKIQRSCYWTLLMWKILVLDYFEVGDSTAGLFCRGRLWYWTILKWEILLLDFFAVGDCGTGLFC